MKMPPLLADFTHARPCKPFCEKYLTLPTDMPFLNFGDLRRKEVINMRDGARLGCICDLEVDQCSGLIRSIVVPGPPRFFGILRSDEELVIPYDRISKIGDDVILVDVVLK